VPTLADRGYYVVSATSPSDRNFDFLDLEALLFLPIALKLFTRLSGPRSRLTAAQKSLATPGIEPEYWVSKNKIMDSEFA
jgi:hypothetical protein